ncbi:MAG TPA: hypothetical protein VNC15_01985 [Solirubrobacterales bacterium]|nr:hypothetical protein [Solirubrobacterales bacterium]
MLTLVSLAGAVALVGAGFSAADPSGVSHAHLRWAMARSSLEHLGAVDAAIARRELDAPGALVQNDPPLLDDPTPAGWSSTSTERWASFRKFAHDVADGEVPAYVNAVHYDDESWSQTPLDEQLHPAAYQRRFCGLAHENGWACLTGPGQDLCAVLSRPRGETYSQCYLDLGLAGKAARYADVIDLQAQALEAQGARAYSRFVRRAARQARAVNPDVVVLANLSSSPGGGAVSAPRLAACAKRALAYVDGYYLTIPFGEAGPMAQAMRAVTG